MTAGFYFKDANMSYCGYAKNDDGAAKLSEASGKTVKKGNILYYMNTWVHIRSSKMKTAHPGP